MNASSFNQDIPIISLLATTPHTCGAFRKFKMNIAYLESKKIERERAGHPILVPGRVRNRIQQIVENK